MKFKMPESLEGLSIADLDKLYLEGHAESQELASLSDDEITDAQLDELETINGHLDSIVDARTALETAATARADRLAAARSKVADSTPAEDPSDDDEDGEDGDEGDGEPTEPTEVVEEEQELVTASAAKRPVVRRAASKTPAPDLPAAKPGMTLIAAANLPGIESNHSFANLSEASQIWGSFASKGAGGTSTPMMNYADTQMIDPQALSKSKQQLGFMRIQKPENAFGITDGMSVQEQLDVIDAAANERARFGSDGLAKRAVLASAAWCAPSETVYDFCSYETVSGILDIPSINLPRGGIKYSKGPDYATLAATWGFLQTEAQVEAATPKVCYPVACPPFLEARLDAVGFCITAGVLTNAAYPELIRRVLEIGVVAHAHKVNNYVIGKISTAIGAAVNHAEIGATTSDLLDAVDLQAMRIRYQLAMAENATLEAILPIWAKAIFRADLSRRTGVAELAVSDQQINSYFAARGVRVQWVYDYQPLDATGTATWTSLPDTLEFMMFPAGAFVKGGLPVIDLDTIYDSVGLSTNTYTAAFFEEGVQVFNRCGFGVKVSVDVKCLAGRTGGHDVTCV
jgi:hypothetical protein